MSDQRSPGGILPTAAAIRRRRIPLIWGVPVITALIALWLAWDTYSKRGPTITITFDSGYGMQPGQSQLRYRDVPMGTVKSIDISKDFSKVVVTVETTNGECWMTFAYSHPLPVDQTSPDAHWARFTWQIFEGFRWSELALAGYATGVWDVTPTLTGTEPVVVPGATGYYTTSSVD